MVGLNTSSIIDDEVPCSSDIVRVLSFVLLSSLASAAVIGTLMDAFIGRCEAMKDFTLFKILVCFSAKSNIKSLVEQKGSTISCFNAFKVLLMFWIVAFHTVNWNAQYAPPPLKVYFSDLKHNSNVVITTLLSARFPVDAFFLMTGFLMTKTLMQQFKRSHVNVLQVIVDRIVRISPSVWIAFLVFLYVVPLLGFNDKLDRFWKIQQDQCSNYEWLRVVFHANDISHPHCFTVSWYVAVDLQLYILAVPIILMISL